MFNRLHDALIGFGDFLGATAPLKPPPKGSPAGKPGPTRKYPKPPRTSTMENHGKALKKGHDVTAHAMAVLANAVRVLAQKSSPAPARGPATASSARLQGRRVQIGAALAATMTSKQKAAVQKHNDAVAKAAKARQTLAQKALAAKASVVALAKKMVTQKKAATLLRKKRSTVHVGHLLADPVVGAAVAEAFQEYYTTVGSEPDLDNPGFLTNGMVDPAESVGGIDPSYVDPSMAATDPASGAPMDLGLPSDLVGPASDPLDTASLGPAPSMDTFIADMAAVGGIAYDGSKGTPEGYVGSYGLFTRQTDSEAAAGGKWVYPIDWMDHYGYVFGKYDKDMNGGIPGGDEIASGKWNAIHGGKGRGDWAHNPDPSEAFASYQKSSPNGKQYGPLVGNPFYKDFAAMRVDGMGNMFWLPQEAPDWLTFPIKQAAALTKQAADKAAADAAAADAAAQAKAAADAAAAQAAQDAANALAESQATSQAKVEQAQAETQAQQALVQQQQADTAQQQIETEQMKSAGDLMLAQAQRADAYYAQHPEEEFAPPADEGGEEGGGDVEDIMPEGGDMMQDADGEGYQDEDEG